jgi:hypothetical protein
LPSESEAVALLKIVLARYPVLKFRNTDGELDSFRGALAYICSLTKMPVPITKYAASWWIDAAQQWCRENGVQGVVRSLLPAIIATGDVQYSFDDRSAIWLDPYRERPRCGRASVAKSLRR